MSARPPRQRNPEANTDALAVIGLVLVCTGISFIYWPASLIVAGLALLVSAYGLIRIREREQ